MPQKILIVEDDISFGTLLRTWFVKNGYEPELTGTCSSATKMLSEQQYSLILTDLRLPDGDGIMILNRVREQGITAPVIVMTSYGEVRTAVSAIKLGAADYLEKPINPALLKQKIEDVMGRENAVAGPVTVTKVMTGAIVYGESPAARIMHEHIRLVAPTRMSVIIYGESGTGKESAARLIHENSDRKNNRFIAVDCGSLSKELAPSELFGHLKGSFTSAMTDKKGVFEEAEGGTVFMDEIGNLSYEVQIQLLRAIQEKKIRRVGASSDMDINVRIIVATNENLSEAVKAGKFREDLFHRLNEFGITVPPLRERREDISTFAMHFLNEANAELGKNIEGFTSEVLSKLVSLPWPGNIRELRNVIRRAALFSSGNIITIENLPALQGFSNPGNERVEIQSLKEDEKEKIIAALHNARGNKSLAAKLLKIDRKTLYNKLHQYGLDI